MADFYYPYSFIRTPSRDGYVKNADGENVPLVYRKFVGDADPSKPAGKQDHSRFWEDHFNGVIPVVLRTKTPLFITDPGTVSSDGDHSTYSCMKHIPATALKGMLSSAYEAVTNSRLRVFKKEQHDRPLGYRSSARATLVPARVEAGENGLCAVLFTGTSALDDPDPLYAAWLPAYRDRRSDRESDDCRSLQNGGKYTAVLRRYKYSRGSTFFDFWNVEEIDGKTFEPITGSARASGEVIKAEGWVVKSGRIFTRKHDERFFFNAPGTKVHRLPLSGKVIESYKILIEDYQKIHERDAKKSALGSHARDARSSLSGGEFVYAEVELDSRGNPFIKGLYPVQISRKLYKKAPWDCLKKGLRPAERLNELSPADRLFGWVPQGGSGAWKGKLRITDARCPGGDPTETFSGGERVMAILGAPKPTQARFYLGDEKGSPQKAGITKEKAGYTEEKIIRGRKVYLHHQRFSEKNVFPGSEPSGLNRSIRDWIPKGREFRFDIRFENLTKLELGCLLWLLTLNEDGAERYFFRLGYGKPLGLGSVSLSIKPDELEVFSGDDMRNRYLSLDDAPHSRRSSDEFMSFRNNFTESLKKNYSNELGIGDALTDGFKRAAEGVAGPVSYSAIDGDPNAESFKWFVENEKMGRNYSGRGQPLPRIGAPLRSYQIEQRGGGRR